MMDAVLPHEDPTISRWSDLQAEQAEAKDKTKALQRSFVPTFEDGGDGQDVLAYLRSITIDKTLPATCSDAELRWAEAQRSLVRHVLNTIERGKLE